MRKVKRNKMLAKPVPAGTSMAGLEAEPSRQAVLTKPSHVCREGRLALMQKTVSRR